MTWHKWLVRGLVFAALGAIVAGCALYAMYTNPSTVRQLVQEKLGVRFQHVSVHVESARLRLLGGIQVNELRLSRSDGLDRDSFLYVPSAVIYHDKEQVLDGKVAVRKLELNGAKLRVVRERDGRFNLAGILGPSELDERVPAVVIRNGSLIFEDRTLAAGTPLLEVRNLQLTVLNDPLPVLQIEGSGTVDVLGPITFHATLSRSELTGSGEISLPAIPIDETMGRRVALVAPELARHLAGVSGKAEVTARVKAQSGAFSHEVALRCDARVSHPQLPAALEKVRLEGRLVDGVVPEAKLTASSGPMTVEAHVKNLRLPSNFKEEPDLDELLTELDLDVRGLNVDEAVLTRLPSDIAFIKEDYSPAGPISFSYRHRKPARGKPSKVWTVRPEGMTGSFCDFRYPLHDVRGTIRLDVSGAPRRNIHLDLSGRGGAASVTLQGHIVGPRATSEVRLEIRGSGLVLDERLRQALPERAQKIAQTFLPENSRQRGLQACPMGTAAFEAAITRQLGTEPLLKRYTVHFKDSAVKYDHFPYPLERLTGTLVLHPNHWEARDFHGHHAGGELFIEGRSFPMSDPAAAPPVGGPAPEQVRVKVRGKNIRLDRELEEALCPRAGNQRAGLREAWKALALDGRLSFEAEVLDTPNQPQDINVAVEVKGVRMRPSFFDYAMSEVSGTVHYLRDRVYLKDMKARHGPAELFLASGTIQVKPEGGFTAWLTGLRGRNVPPDEALLHALPEGARKSLRAVKPERPLNGSGQLTIVHPGGPAAAVQVWWEGALTLDADRFQAGIQVTGASGRFYSKGHHDGRRLRGVTADLALRQATVLGQPLNDVTGRLEVRGDSPEIIRFRDLKATLFGGRVGGEARIETGGVFRYEVLLEGAGLQLARFSQHNFGTSAPQAQMSGDARAALHLMGEGSDLIGLKGNGRIDVPHGKMGQLPVLLDLVKAFGLRLPDRTAFEQAQAIFRIEGPQMRVQHLDLMGNAVCLRGAGTVDLDGSNLNLDFSATPGKPLTALLNPGDAIPPLLSQQLFKIKVRGKLGQNGQVRFDKELMPAVVGPIKKLLPN